MIENDYIEVMLPAIRAELEAHLAHSALGRSRALISMLRYHMGWEGQGSNQDAEGKRIRPILTLLSTEASGGVWELALPAAAAVELIHNFSLIHDDIEDNSDLRRGRDTVWKKWGVAQAINTGDLMFSIANLAVHRLDAHFDSMVINRASQIILETCILLTQGQYWDIAYENQMDVTIEQYWTMVEGKTGALLGASCELGALCSPATPEQRRLFKTFGFQLGMAFQAIDDYLGIWGDPAKLGKSVESDLISKKKTLPVVFGLQSIPRFSELWMQSKINAEDACEMARMLEVVGAKDYVLAQAKRHTDNAFKALHAAGKNNEAREAIQSLASGLLKRDY